MSKSIEAPSHIEPIRILQVIGKMDYAGAETMIMNFYRNLNRSKLQFDFLVFSEEEGAYEKEIEELGGRIYHLPAFKIYNVITFTKRIRFFFKEHSYKIVHGHIRSSAAIYLSEAKRMGAYTIAHCHATKNDNAFVSFLYFLLTYRIRNTADFFLACSQKAGVDGFGKKIVDSNRFNVLKNAIKIEKYRYSIERHEKLKDKYKLKEKFVIGHVGRFCEVKNHKFILEVFDEVLKRDDKARLVLVGGGELKLQIEKQAKEMNLAEKVVFLGVRDDIPDLLNMFDVFLFPSLYEGLGIALIEAQTAGLPCVVSDAIVDEAVITDNVKRISLKSNVAVWAKKILSFRDGFHREDCSGVAADHGFSIDSVVKKIEEIYTGSQGR